MRSRAARVIVWDLGICLLLDAFATAGLYAAMRQTPETFGAIMSRVPTRRNTATGRSCSYSAATPDRPSVREFPN